MTSNDERENGSTASLDDSTMCFHWENSSKEGGAESV